MSIVGIDEVGRGAWAGPVVAAAVLLGPPIAGLYDSKSLTKAKRTELAKIIHSQATAIGIGWVAPEVVDRLGLTKALAMAMKQALDKITNQYEKVIIDGNYNFLPDNPRVVTKIKADETIAAVSAASIVAKVARDEHMAELSLRYPYWGFDKHVGYGTKKHIDAIARHGICEIHRRSYKPLTKFL